MPVAELRSGGHDLGGKRGSAQTGYQRLNGLTANAATARDPRMAGGPTDTAYGGRDDGQWSIVNGHVHH